MRHGKRGRYLSRNSSHRTSLYRNLVLALLTHEKITTTVQKAKELRPYIERLITVAKRGVAAGDAAKALHARRLVIARLGPVAKVDLLTPDGEPTGETVVGKIFSDLAVRYAGRAGGYTRILKLSKRRLGDAGETAVIELLKTGEEKVVAKKATGDKAPTPAPVAVTTGDNA